MGREPTPCPALTGRRGTGYLNIALLHRDCQQAAAIRQVSGLNFPTG